MQRHKSVEKRDLTSKKANLANRAGRSKINTAAKKVMTAQEPVVAGEALKKAFSVLDKSVKTGLIHKNKAANQKSKLAKIVNKVPAK